YNWLASQPVILLVLRVSFYSLWLRTRRQFPANSPFTQNYVQALTRIATGEQQVNHAGATMGRVVESIKNVSGIVQEISVASAEQTRGLEQINQAIAQIDEATQRNAALVEEASAASSTMKQEAASLTQLVSTFKLSSTAGTVVAEIPRRQFETLPA
ncbi:methyl-accepting chemotaxis protein, partial [Herbaspirillum huttiense]|uniref:methyl-accepting chemotaxis protein n=1 Tax=Herbaspirillum huttiense TaxID=863372 RepID=UPI002E75BC85